jgi:transglutaminase-like putative cysteine protease
MATPVQTYYIKHIERATFHTPVYCEPTTVRLHPRTDGEGWVRSTRIDVSPRPAMVRAFTDLANNLAWRIWFNDITVSLTVTVTSCVDRCWKPSDPLLHHDTTSWRQAEYRDPLLQYYLQVDDQAHDAGSLVERVLDHCGPTPLSFLMHLAQTVARQYQAEAAEASASKPLRAAHTRITFPAISSVATSRHESRTAAHRFARQAVVLAPASNSAAAPGPPEEAQGLRGARRRAEEAFVRAARLANIPTRCVRGYSAADADELDTEMRSWVECYLGDFGWFGIDPCTGRAADHTYVPVASGRASDALACVCGEYRGSSAAPEWSTQIILRQASHGQTPEASASSVGVPVGR